MQTYSTAAREMPNDTATDLVTTASTNVAPYGFASQAQADGIAAEFNRLRGDLLA